MRNVHIKSVVRSQEPTDGRELVAWTEIRCFECDDTIEVFFFWKKGGPTSHGGGLA